MTNPLPPITKSKPVMISTAASVLTIGYKILDAVGNADFALAQLGFSEGAAKFLGSPRTIDVMVSASLLALVCSLVYQVNRLMEAATVTGQPDQSTATPAVVTAPEESKETPKPAPAPEEKPAPRIVPVTVTPENLTGLFKDHTAAQAQRLIQPYIGMWMNLTGVVSEVVNHDDYVTVYMYENDGLTAASFRDATGMASAAILRRKDVVTIFGRIRGVSRNGLSLDECQLVEARPPEKVPEEWKSS